MSSLTCCTEPPTFPAPNNYWFDFPAIMADSRVWSQWQPDAVRNRDLQQRYGITNNWNYRQILQTQSPPTQNNWVPPTTTPLLFSSVLDAATTTSSDLKSPYLTREQLNARLIAPAVSLQPK